MIPLDTRMKLAEIESEQDKYKMTMTYEETVQQQLEHYKSIGQKPFTLDEINQYIKEVRDAQK